MIWFVVPHLVSGLWRWSVRWSRGYHLQSWVPRPIPAWSGLPLHHLFAARLHYHPKLQPDLPDRTGQQSGTYLSFPLAAGIVYLATNICLSIHPSFIHSLVIQTSITSIILWKNKEDIVNKYKCNVNIVNVQWKSMVLFGYQLYGIYIYIYIYYMIFWWLFNLFSKRTLCSS